MEPVKEGLPAFVELAALADMMRRGESSVEFVIVRNERLQFFFSLFLSLSSLSSVVIFFALFLSLAFDVTGTCLFTMQCCAVLCSLMLTRFGSWGS